jgi:hypothetical protein
MTAKLFDRVIVQTSTTGTGDYALGSAATGYQDFGDAGASSGDTVAYFITDSLTEPVDWEIGEGVFTPGNPANLTRATIKGSTNAGAAVDWDTGTKFVVSGPSAAWLSALLVAANNLSDLVNVATARANLGLGSAALSDSTDFAAAVHTHIASSVTDFSEAVDDRVASLLVEGTNITLTYDDAAGSLTIDAADSGSSTLAGDTDVTITSAADGDLLTYETSSTKWKNKRPKESFTVAVGDETTALTTGTGKRTFRMPFAMTLTEVRASLTTASSSGIPAFDVNESGVSIFSTTLTIDATETSSTTATTAAVISDSSLADDAEITIDIDTAGTAAAGLKITFIGTRT